MKESIIGLLILAATFGAWLTHVITCITLSKWILLFVGAIFFPVGIVHGWMVWLGF